MRKLVHHGPGGVQEIVLPAGVAVHEARELGVEGNGSENPVKGKSVL
jgi:hypothetical protein